MTQTTTGSPVARHTPRVLIVDDEEHQIASIEFSLRSGGFTSIATAGDGHEAMELLRNEDVDLLLLDISMPVMTGPEVLARIQDEQIDVEVIIISASGSAEQVASCVSEGIARYLTKPFSKTELLEAVGSVLRTPDPQARTLKEFFLSPHARLSAAHGGSGRSAVLLNARDEFRTMFEKSPVPTFVLDAESRALKYWNRAFAGLLLADDDVGIERWWHDRVEFAAGGAGHGADTVDGDDVDIRTGETSARSGVLYLSPVDHGHHLQGYFVDLTELRRQERAQIELIQELQHRVHNNLQMISSLLSHDGGIHDGCTCNASARARIRALARIHRYLSQTTGSVAERFERLTWDLFGDLRVAAESRARMRLEVELRVAGLRLGDAIPLATIVYEAMRNAIAHAFAGGSAGHITVRLNGHDELLLEIVDDGVGFDLPERNETTGGLGIMVMTGLAQQLGGDIAIYRNENDGTTVSARIPSQPQEARQ